MTSITHFIAAHHLKFFLVLFFMYVAPALTRWGLMKAKALPPGSKWDVRLRKIMKFALDTTNYDDVETKLDEVETKVLEAVEAIDESKSPPADPPRLA